jgi:hypothetical protein
MGKRKGRLERLTVKGKQRATHYQKLLAKDLGRQTQTMTEIH